METEKLIDMIESAIESDYYKSLVNRGEDRGSFLIKKQDSEEPQEMPSLKYNMHFFGTALLSLAMSLKEVEAENYQETLKKAFNCAGEVIKLAVINGETENNDNFFSILSAASFQLGGSIDEANFMTDKIEEHTTLSPFELVFLQLVKRHSHRFDSLIDELRESTSDQNLCNELDKWNKQKFEDRGKDDTEQEDINFLDELLERAITDKFCSGIQFFSEFIQTNNDLFFEIAKGELKETLEQTEKLDFVNLWWYTRLSMHLIDVWPRKE